MDKTLNKIIGQISQEYFDADNGPDKVALATAAAGGAAVVGKGLASLLPYVILLAIPSMLGGIIKGTGSAAINIAPELGLALLAAPVAAGYGLGRVGSSILAPKKTDWEALRKKEKADLYNMYAARAEQSARQLVGEAD